MMVGRYFGPTIARKAILFPLMALFIILAADFCGLGRGTIGGTLQLELLSWALVISPIIFTKQAADEVFYSLPALGCEKVCFVFLWSFIVVPMMLILPATAYIAIFMPEISGSSLLTGGVMSAYFSAITDGSILTVGLLSTASAIGVGLWAVFGSRRCRARNGILAIMGTIFINVLTGFALGFISALKSDSSAATTENLSVNFDTFAPALTTFWAIFLIFALWKAAQAISRKQV